MGLYLVDSQARADLLDQLRAIGWTDDQIGAQYPDLLPAYYSEAPASPPSSTLYERLLTIGWTEEKIRAEYPDILPESEGGIVETVGEPVYTLGDRAGEPKDPGLQHIAIGEPYGGDPVDPLELIFDPRGVLQPGLVSGGDLPAVGGSQTQDLFTLALLFL